MDFPTNLPLCSISPQPFRGKVCVWTLCSTNGIILEMGLLQICDHYCWPALQFQMYGINTFHSGRLKLKSSSLHMFLCGKIFTNDCARELFKSSKDSASLCVCNEKSVLFFCEWCHNKSCFRPVWPTSSDTRPKLLDGSISLKFLLETRLKNPSFLIL